MLLCAALLPLAACLAERKVVVTTNPPGAEARFDDTVYGVTPVAIPFVYYGVHRLTLQKEGYLAHSELLDIGTPWYAYFPIDIVTEILIPVGWKDTRHVDVVLQPGVGKIPPPDLESVLARAESLRRAGPEGPRASVPARRSELPPAEDDAVPPGASDEP